MLNGTTPENSTQKMRTLVLCKLGNLCAFLAALLLYSNTGLESKLTKAIFQTLSSLFFYSLENKKFYCGEGGQQT